MPSPTFLSASQVARHAGPRVAMTRELGDEHARREADERAYHGHHEEADHEAHDPGHHDPRRRPRS